MEFLIHLPVKLIGGMLVKFFSKTKLPAKDSDKKPADEMSFFEHLDELRGHIFRSLIWISLFAVGGFIWKDLLFRELIFAPRYPDFWTYKILCKVSHLFGMGEALCITPPQFNVQAVEFGELFTTHMKVAFLMGVILAIPFIFLEIWKFIKPGLYPNERKAARGFVVICSSLFLIGVLFGYFIISPFSVTFLAGYQIEGAISAPSLASYVNYMVMFTLPVGLVFQLPIVVYFLSKIGIVTPDFMKNYRRHAIVIIFIVAAVVTPPDVVSQMLVATPLLILYELSIVVSARTIKQQELKEKAAENN